MNNSRSNNTTVSGGIGFCGLLGIVFIVLKLLGVITWSWKIVLMPIWLPIAAWIIFFVVWLLIIKWLSK